MTDKKTPDPERADFDRETIPREHLRALLVELGCSQEQLARRAALSTSGLAKWLGGQRSLSVVVWRGILASVGKPLDWEPPKDKPPPR